MMPITSGAPVRTAGQKPRILVADKNPVVRTGLAELIARDGRFDIVTTVATGGAFIAACMESQVDIGLIGWSLPDMTGGDVLEVLKRRQIGTRVIIYTGEAVSDVLRQTIKSGAWGSFQKAMSRPCCSTRSRGSPAAVCVSPMWISKRCRRIRSKC